MKKIYKILLEWFSKNLKLLKFASILLNACSFIIFLLWVSKSLITEKFNIEFSLDLEALFVGTTSFGLLLNQIHRKLLEESEYSPAYALAYGYVNNFISPAITQLKEDGNINPKICIYRPNHFDELSTDNVDRVKAELQNKMYNVDTINLNFKHGRAKDLISLHKNEKLKSYFDFPNTLLSLYSYVDYKIGSISNSSTEEKKKELIGELIKSFYDKIDELFSEKGLSANIRYCDRKLNNL